MPNFPSRLEFRWVIASWMERVMGSLSPSYEGKDQRYFSGVRKDLIDRLGVDANRAILEIGCGDGSTGAYAKVRPVRRGGPFPGRSKRGEGFN
jgi:hypothetical protein